MPTPPYTPIIDTDTVFSINGWDTDDTVLYEEVTALLPYAISLAEQYCQTNFSEYAEDETVLYSGRNTKFMILSRYYTSITAVTTIIRSAGAVDTRVEIPLEYVRPFPPNSRIPGFFRALKIPNNAPYKFIDGEGNIEIVGTYGFRGETVPKPLQIAISHIVKHTFDLRDHNETVKREYGANRSYDVNLNTENIPRHIMHLLDHYRLNNSWQ
jgi:hypothetical protein